MHIIPAIDLRDGKCVRLYQGDYSRETIYSDDPREVALSWAYEGAHWLHIVDLDGARAGNLVNIETIRSLTSSVSLNIQVGGGIRTIEIAESLISLGVARIIIGTAAVKNPGIIRAFCESLGSQAVVVSVDALDGCVSLEGWTERSEISVIELVEQMSEMGVSRFIYTDIARDGTLTEPNYRAVEEITSATDAKFMIAGGISSIEHIRQLQQTGIEGVIVGKALYEGKVSLQEALNIVKLP